MALRLYGLGGVYDIGGATLKIGWNARRQITQRILAHRLRFSIQQQFEFDQVMWRLLWPGILSGIRSGFFRDNG